MQRRRFISAATALGLVGAAGRAGAAECCPAVADTATGPAEGHGACGLSCAACRMRLNGSCGGCGQGAKADCPVLQCARMHEVAYCAQCPGLPCPKLHESGKLSDAWMQKTGKAALPKG